MVSNHGLVFLCSLLFVATAAAYVTPTPSIPKPPTTTPTKPYIAPIKPPTPPIAPYLPPPKAPVVISPVIPYPPKSPNPPVVVKPPPVGPYPPKTPSPPAPAPFYGSLPPVKKQECEGLCGKRCVKHSRMAVCMRACTTCCTRCKCVPPGTFGNKELCGRCYTDMTTHGGRLKCP